MGHGWRTLAVALLVSILLCSSCATTNQVSLIPTPAPAQLTLEAGRKAVILLRSGEEIIGTIVEADDRSLTVRTKSGSIRGVAYEEMESLQTSRNLPGRTAAVIGGGILAGGAAYLAVILIKAKRTEETD